MLNKRHNMISSLCLNFAPCLNCGSLCLNCGTEFSATF